MITVHTQIFCHFSYDIVPIHQLVFLRHSAFTLHSHSVRDLETLTRNSFYFQCFGVTLGLCVNTIRTSIFRNSDCVCRDRQALCQYCLLWLPFRLTQERQHSIPLPLFFASPFHSLHLQQNHIHQPSITLYQLAQEMPHSHHPLKLSSYPKRQRRDQRPLCMHHERPSLHNSDAAMKVASGQNLG